jgi:hypothetical protein
LLATCNLNFPHFICVHRSASDFGELSRAVATMHFSVSSAISSESRDSVVKPERDSEEILNVPFIRSMRGGGVTADGDALEEDHQADHEKCADS